MNSACVVMDHTPWEIDWSREQGEVHPRECAIHMKELYLNSLDQHSHDMPEPLEECVHVCCFVDADHADNKITRRLNTEIIIFLTSAPII